MYYYKAFGFYIESEINLPVLSAAEVTPRDKNDICIRRGKSCTDQKEYQTEDAGKIIKTDDGCLFLFQLPDVGAFMIENGQNITVSAPEAVPDELLSVYLLGSCMGCIFQQRGLFAMHGSCICKDEKAVLVCGSSGAGKSTLAAEFLKNGWQLMTDDVAVLHIKKNKVFVHSSYPSQKLWQDGVEHFAREEERLTPLMQKQRKEKFNVRMNEEFYDGECELALIVNLYSGGDDWSVREINGFEKAKRIIGNIYLDRCLANETENAAAIKTAFDVAMKTKMTEAIRNCEFSSTEKICKEIKKRVLGENYETQ